MAISNSSDFTQTRDQIITDALVSLGVYRPGATVNAKDISICSNWLNKIVKAWDAKGIHMWAQTEATLFLRKGAQQYSLSPTSTDIAGIDCVDTYLLISEGGSTLQVASTAGMNIGDKVAIQTDANDVRDFRVILTVDSPTQITLTANLSGTCSAGNRVTTFSKYIDNPLVVTSARLRADGNDRPIYMRGRDEFMSIPTKDIEGKANQVYFTAGIDAGKMYVWPAADSTADTLRFSYVRKLSDFDTGTDNPDFPAEWLETLTLNLMAKVASIYGKPMAEVAVIKQEAAMSLMEMMLWDLDNGSIRIVPNYVDD